MKLLINDYDNQATTESLALLAAVRRCHLFDACRGNTYVINTAVRGQPGFPQYLEWSLIYCCDDNGRYVKGQSMVVGMVQRDLKADFEFHS